MMPLLFFIAGYFAIPSLDRRGAKYFLKNKVIRLGIPYLIGVMIVSSTMPFIRCHIRSYDGNSTVPGYGEYWLSYIKSLGDFRIENVTQTTELVINPYWFIGLLLVFFVPWAFKLHF